MGKVVHYHPVSLTVLRAAAIYGGFRFGKISQTVVNSAEQMAVYIVEIVAFPDHLYPKEPEVIETALQGCFAADVKVASVYFTSRLKKWKCCLIVRLRPYKTPEDDIEGLRWLVDNDTEVGAVDLYGREVGTGELSAQELPYDGLPF